MIKVNWEQGIKVLMSTITTKVIIMSINDVDSLVLVVKKMNGMLEEANQTNPSMAS
jgi:hypothetical protein